MPQPKRHDASPERQDAAAPAAWKVLARRYAAGSSRPMHRHATAQLVFSTCGLMQVHTPQSRWTVLPQRALWVPPQHDHAIEVLSATELRTVYFEPGLVAGCPGFARSAQVHALETSALINELVKGLFNPGHAPLMQAQTAALLLHALGGAACLPTRLPLPAGEPLRRAVMPLLAQGQWHRSLDDVAAEAAMSARTFTRRFTLETGMSFRAWRQHARLLASFDLLAGDRPLKAIAASLGFSSSSAYVAAFREAFGFTPEAFRRNQWPAIDGTAGA
jgi:AraC-like DNA-binding protein